MAQSTGVCPKSIPGNDRSQFESNFSFMSSYLTSSRQYSNINLHTSVIFCAGTERRVPRQSIPLSHWAAKSKIISTVIRVSPGKCYPQPMDPFTCPSHDECR